MKNNKSNWMLIIKSVAFCLGSIFGTLMIGFGLPTLTIKLADIAKIACALFIIAVVVKTIIPTIKVMWKNYCEKTDKAPMKALLAYTMAIEYGIDINDPKHLEHGSPLRMLINDVNWPKKFNQYKYQFGVAPKSDAGKIDTYALMHQNS